MKTMKSNFIFLLVLTCLIIESKSNLDSFNPDTNLNEQNSTSSSSSSSSDNVKEALLLNENKLEPFIFMCIVYTISTLCAIVTNLIVILVYLYGNSVKTELSVFLVNLAIADFLMSTFCMPFTFAQVLLNQWVFGSVMCPIVLFQQVLTVSLSIYTMVAIGIDRFYAIKSPLKNRVNQNNNKGKLTILTVWFIAVSLASIQLFVARIIPSVPISSNKLMNNNKTSQHFNESSILIIKKSNEITYTCNENWSEDFRKTYTVFNFFAVYLIPVVMLIYTYARIAFILKKSTPPGNSDASRDLNYNKSKNKVIKMLIVLVCAFTLCWLPLHMFTLINDFTHWLDMFNPKTVTLFYYVSHWLAMANCTINPFIYGYSNKKFRSDAYWILICRCRSRKQRNQAFKTANILLARLPVPNPARDNSQKRQSDLILNQGFVVSSLYGSSQRKK